METNIGAISVGNMQHIEKHNKKIQLTVGSAVRFQRPFLYQSSVLWQSLPNICQRQLI